MSSVNNESVAKIIEEVAQSVIVPRFNNLAPQDIAYKKENDPVTIVDKEAEKELSRRLLDLLPGSNVVGEEAFAENSSISDLFFDDSPVWVIDPIDGTKAFIAGRPFYGVIVALTKQNQTVAGWLYDPTSREIVTAEKGAGAWHKGRRLSILKPDEIANMNGVLGPKIRKAFKAEGFAVSEETFPRIFRTTSACHDYAGLVAKSFSERPQLHFHAWFDFCSPWDCSAGILVHAEAGGYAAHWNGDPFLPSHFGRGIMAAPDKPSWLAIRKWIAAHCALPE